MQSRTARWERSPDLRAPTRPIVEFVYRHPHSLSFSLLVASLVDLLELLLLEGSGLGKLDGDLVRGEFGVGIGHGIKLVLNEHLVQRVQVDGLSRASGVANACAAAHNAGGNDDIIEDSGVHGLKGTASGALLAGVSDLSLGVNGPVDDNNDGPLELLLEAVNHLAGDLLVELKGSVRDLDEDVLSHGTVVGLELALLNRVDEHHAQVLLDLFVGLLEGSEGLGGVLLKFGGFDLLK